MYVHLMYKKYWVIHSAVFKYFKNTPFLGWGGCRINNDGGDSDRPSATKTFYAVHWKLQLHEITIQCIREESAKSPLLPGKAPCEEITTLSRSYLEQHQNIPYSDFLLCNL